MINFRSIKKGALCVMIALVFLGCKEEDPKPPVSSLLTLPSNGENCNTGTSISITKSSVQFSWEEAANTSSYILTIKNLQTQEEEKRTEILTTSTTIDLDKGFGYSWFVTSSSDYFLNDLPVSETWYFYLQGNGESNGAPFMADLLSPEAGEAISLTNGSFDLDWTGVDPDGDQLVYTLYLDTVDGFQPPKQEFTNLMSSSISAGLEVDTVYFWRIYSQDSHGNDSYSQVYSFRTLQ